MLYMDIHIFLRVGVRVHSLSVLLKLRVRDTDYDMNSFAHLSKIVGIPFINLFYLWFEDNAPLFWFIPIAIFWIWNDMIGWLTDLVGLFEYICFIWLVFDLLNHSCNELERLLSECECLVLLLSQQFFSRFKVDLMLHNAPNIFSPSPMTFSLSFIFSFFSSPPHASTHLQNITLPSASVVSFVCALLKCHNNWGEHAGKPHKMENMQMRKKTDLFRMCF